jgi:dephospho-CoA kinase
MIAEKRPPVLGLIGGIGSGKSRVAAELIRHGARVIAADEFGHEALRQPPIKEALLQRWGNSILREDGEINRRRLGAIVFADPAERRALEAEVFPFIERRIKEEVAKACQDSAARCVVLDAAIMLETGWDRVCDWVIYIHAPRAQRWLRLARSRGWTEKEVLQRSQAQLPLTAKVTRADFVIDNSGDEDYLQKRVDKLLKQLHNLNYKDSLNP